MPSSNDIPGNGMPVVGTERGGVLALGDGERAASPFAEPRTMTYHFNPLPFRLREPRLAVEIWLPVDDLRAAREAGHIRGWDLSLYLTFYLTPSIIYFAR
jgi:hypothetical protein